MSARTEATSPDSPQPAGQAPRKPLMALAIATAGGLGYIPWAPGTWGSLAGGLIYGLLVLGLPLAPMAGGRRGAGTPAIWSAGAGCAVALLLALVGVVAADRAANFLERKDPSCVVIDEVSGQFLTYLLALTPLNWKYLVLGLILFRVFDIWKPAPARQAESLRGGLGIMADDWIAGIYAAIVLWVVRSQGL